MEGITFVHITGIALTLLLIVGCGIYSGRQVKSGDDFSGGGRNSGTAMVAGMIMGTLVGGSATVGTAQLAYVHGFSACWFTFGSAIGCLLLGVFFSRRMYESGEQTISSIIVKEYGRKVGNAASVLGAVGIFINIVAQILAASVLIESIFPIPAPAASLLAILIMMAYVVFGGVKGAAMVGIVKLVLTYISVIICGVLLMGKVGALGGFLSGFSADGILTPFARGILTDGGAGLSVIIGVLSTQSYVQAVLSAAGTKEARKGAIISAVLIPPIGCIGILIGLYMRANFPGLTPSAAFPQFVLNYMPPLLAGITLATLLVVVVGAGAGLTLGISTIFTRDICQGMLNRKLDGKKSLMVSRAAIVAALVGAFTLTLGNMGSFINNWSFMSMGLRGAAIFVPLCGACFLKGKIPKGAAYAAVIVGPIMTLAGRFILPSGIDPVFLGILAALLIFAAGAFAGRRKPA